MLKLRLEAKAAKSDAVTRFKRFNALVEQTTKEVKMKEKEIESIRMELHSLEDSLKLLCGNRIGKKTWLILPFFAKSQLVTHPVSFSRL
jgi:chromosome segregation ATPase